jgi:serine/threonine-protein phosphatase 2B catalytic subunit
MFKENNKINFISMDKKSLTLKKNSIFDKTRISIFKSKTKTELKSNEKIEVKNEDTKYNLEDILIDRVMKNVSYPAIKKLSISDVFDKNDKPRIAVLESHFFNEGRLAEETAKKIITLAEAILRSEQNLLYVKPPVTIVGDIHGQYYDLLTAINHGGVPGETKYLFLGDYVDRGSFSMEVLLYLYSLKILHPDSIFLLR